MKALVLSSGGVDSTTVLAMAVEKYGKENGKKRWIHEVFCASDWWGNLCAADGLYAQHIIKAERGAL